MSGVIDSPSCELEICFHISGQTCSCSARRSFREELTYPPRVSAERANTDLISAPQAQSWLPTRKARLLCLHPTMETRHRLAELTLPLFCPAVGLAEAAVLWWGGVSWPSYCLDGSYGAVGEVNLYYKGSYLLPATIFSNGNRLHWLNLLMERTVWSCCRTGQIAVADQQDSACLPWEGRITRSWVCE